MFKVAFRKAPFETWYGIIEKPTLLYYAIPCLKNVAFPAGNERISRRTSLKLLKYDSYSSTAMQESDLLDLLKSNLDPVLVWGRRKM